MKKRILAIALASTLTLGACSFLNAPVGPVPVQTDGNIVATFMAIDASLIAISFVPGLPPAAVIEAKKLQTSIETAYNTYKTAEPTDVNKTNYEKILESSIVGAQAFLAQQQVAMHSEATTKALTLKQMDAVQSVK